MSAPDTSLVERPLRTMKHGDSFAVLDGYGDIGCVAGTAEGLFHEDMRHLSRMVLRFEGRRPLLLSSVFEDDNACLAIDLANPDQRPDGICRDLIAIQRKKFLWDNACHERIMLRNHDLVPHRFRIELSFDADFDDLFAVRGYPSPPRGTRGVAVEGPAKVIFRYHGLDKTLRRTVIAFEPAPETLTTTEAQWTIELPAGGHMAIAVCVGCDGADQQRPLTGFLSAYRARRRHVRAETQSRTKVESANGLFNEVIERASADLAMLTTQTPEGPYPYAGVPWYSTVFGRDGIITAMMMLWADPGLAGGVLRHLAATQATAVDPAADAQPGKILHERREGELARTGIVPFRRYYGTVDATPLFVWLAGEYYDRTGDRALIEQIWPAIEKALFWCDSWGDADSDGFVEYARENDNGLVNQGWKDSHDSIFHADGALAKGPIALCEVQGYVYAARRAAARLARVLGREGDAERLQSQADALRLRFNELFWDEALGTYVLALDGRKQPCRVRSSNAGHALWTGIATQERAERVARTLMGRNSFTGWGLRTIPTSEVRYNPMSYHNGSVWPHDNALIALGFARYGLKESAAAVFGAAFDVALYQEHRRLPELFCGFHRQGRRGPVAYPVACAPQAWAAATPFALLGACLGLELDRERNEVRLHDPVLPDFLDAVILRDLALGDTRLDLRLHRHGSDVTVNVLARYGDARVMLTK